MKRFAIIAATMALISGLLLKGTFGHWIAVLTVTFCLGAPLAMFTALWLVIGLKRTGGVPEGLRATLLVVAILGASLLMSLGTGAAIHYWEIQQTRAYVAKLVPKLESYRQSHGKYPESLAAIAAPRAPKLLRDTHSYSGGADFFRFEYWDKAGMMDGYSFDSSTREWSYFD